MLLESGYMLNVFHDKGVQMGSHLVFSRGVVSY